MTFVPARFTACAAVTRGTFEAELMVDGDTPAEAFATLTALLKAMRLKSPRGQRHAHLSPVVRIDLHSRVDVLPDADAYAAAQSAHMEQLATHAHGLHYALCEGTPEVFAAAEPIAAPVLTRAVYVERPYMRRAPRYADRMPSNDVLHAQFGGSACRF